VLVVACAGGAATRHLVDARVLEALGPDGVLVNVARGSIVDTDALVAALRERRIAGAALDVFENQPQVPADLLALDSVLLTPHLGTASRETRRRMGRMVYESLVDHFEGRELRHRVV
jgi:lactate dehydrogenase-like 2-hydroxyacid dehydrogenase